MIALLGFVLDGIELIGSYVAYGGEVVVNVVIAAAAAAAAALMALLPSMPDLPSIGDPSWLNWLNWFYPVGDLLAIISAAVTSWLSFLAIRWALRIVRAI